MKIICFVRSAPVLCALASGLVGPGLAASPQAARRSAQLDANPAPAREAGVSADLLRSEYAFHPVAGESGVWSASNRSQELRSRISRDGIEVFSRATIASGTGAPWRLRLAMTSFGRAGEACELPREAVAVAKVNCQRVELDHVLLTEWFENGERGIEQGWTIPARPAGDAPLWIGLELGGDLSLRVDEGARSGVLVDAAGVTRLVYGDLEAWDATGRMLEARLVSRVTGVGVRIDDAGAVYPVTVDPALTCPWTVESDQFAAALGNSVASAGDVNGDGYDDVIVGAHFFSNGETGEGRALVYLGSATGLATGPAWTAESDQFDAHFGDSVASAGDVNGDGFDDVIVGAPSFGNGEVGEGRAHVYLGSATGLATSPAWVVESNQFDANFGTSVASAGDANGDGFADVIVGAPHFGDGRAYVYLGSATGLATSPVWVAESAQFGAEFGTSVASAGDVSGDGYGEVIVGAHIGEGRALVYLGSATGPAIHSVWMAASDLFGAELGSSVASAGDVDGDGFADVIVGAPGFSNGEVGEGRAYVYTGSAGFLSATVFAGDAINADTIAPTNATLGSSWSAPLTIGHAHGASGPTVLRLRTTTINGSNFASPFGGRLTEVLIGGPLLGTFAGSHNGVSGDIPPQVVPSSIALVGLPWAVQYTVAGGGFVDLSQAVYGVVVCQ